MTTTTSAASVEQQLLPLLQKALTPLSFDSVQIIQTIEQASAVGYVIRLVTAETSTAEHTNDNNSNYYFIKRVDAARYLSTKSDWPDLRRALLYARTEARFYQQFAPRLAHNLFPRVYAAEYQLQEWIPDDEDGMQPADEHMVQLYPHLPNPHKQNGTLILEYLSDTHYFQDSPLTIQQCHLSLKAIAQLHAAAWQKVDLLQDAATQLSRSSFHLSMRNPKELKGIEAAWDHFALEFAEELNELSWSRTHLGRRVSAVAQYVSDQLSVAPDSPFATLCHGDYKSMNVFLPQNSSDEARSAVLVDFASVGIGLGVTDVAMHLHHCLVPDDLEANEVEMVRYYWQVVQEHAPQSGRAYTWDVVWRQYQYAVVDYFRFFLGRFWKSATHASMHKLKDNKNTNLINRSVPAAMAFVKRVDQYLALVEAEFDKVQ